MLLRKKTTCVLPVKSEKCFWLQNLGKPLLVSKFVANLLFINFAKKKKKKLPTFGFGS